MSRLIVGMVGRGRRATIRVLGLLCFCSVPQASIITPGPGAFPPDIFTMAGATFVAGLSTPVVSSNGALTLTVNTGVYSDPTNAFCVGCYDFVYQISNAPTSRDSVGRVTGINFTGFQTDVGFLPTGSSLAHGFVNGSVSPELVDRVNARVVGFSFNAPLTLLIPPGSTSVVLVVQTDARNLKAGNVNVIDGGVTTVGAFAPAPLPTPL